MLLYAKKVIRKIFILFLSLSGAVTVFGLKIFLGNDHIDLSKLESKSKDILEPSSSAGLINSAKADSITCLATLGSGDSADSY